MRLSNNLNTLKNSAIRKKMMKILTIDRKLWFIKNMFNFVVISRRVRFG